jgi:hypothetical protein
MRQFAVALLLLATVHAQQNQRVRSSQLPGKAHRKTRMLSTPTCTDTVPDCGPGWMCSCTSGRRLFGAPAGAVCTCMASYMPPPPPAFSIDMNGWSNLGPTSAYNTGSFGTPPIADNANCASKDANVAGFIYTFNLPTFRSYDVIVTFGTSSGGPKTYLQWDQMPTNANGGYLASLEDPSTQHSSSAGMSDKSMVRTFRATVGAGTHTLYIGSVSDGNSYMLPFCQIQVI